LNANCSIISAWSSRTGLRLLRQYGWLGGGVIVCPGVSIGENTVVGAGAVVTRDLPSGVVAAGVPARVIREIDDRDRIEIPQLSS